MSNLWNTPSVPHAGWECVTVIDIGKDNGEICEMCGQEGIRYVHIMKHINYHKELAVGCVCAEKMSNDYVNPGRLERSLRNKAARRVTFMQRPWNISKNGNYYIKYKDEVLTIINSKYRKGEYGISGIGDSSPAIWRTDEGKPISSLEQAKLIAFEVFDAFKQKEALRAESKAYYETEMFYETEQAVQELMNTVESAVTLAGYKCLEGDSDTLYFRKIGSRTDAPSFKIKIEDIYD